MGRRWGIIPTRGVYRDGLDKPAQITGSSPLARGLQELVLQAVAEPGIIPARAGLTALLLAHGWVVPDHPRSRGVYVTADCIYASKEGSSPLARGLHDIAIEHIAQRGIIPARAGFTSRLRRPTRQQPDHPRSRGVYCPSRATAEEQDGSSPLARGLRSG